jgi:hypothetical protein
MSSIIYRVLCLSTLTSSLVFAADGDSARKDSDLIEAVVQENIPLVRSLLEQKADVNARDTRLVCVRRCSDGSIGGFALGKIRRKDESRRKNERTKYRVLLTPDPIEVTREDAQILEHRCKLRRIANIIISKDLDVSPLYWTLVKGNVTLAELLLSSGADVWATVADAHGKTKFLDFAADNLLEEAKHVLHQKRFMIAQRAFERADKTRPEWIKLRQRLMSKANVPIARRLVDIMDSHFI